MPTIEIDHNIGKAVYILYKGNIEQGIIKSITQEYDLGLSSGKTKIEYLVELAERESFDTTTTLRLENKTFGTRQEAAYHWLKTQGLEPSEIVQGYFQRKMEET